MFILSTFFPNHLVFIASESFRELINIENNFKEITSPARRNPGHKIIIYFNNLQSVYMCKPFGNIWSMSTNMTVMFYTSHFTRCKCGQSTRLYFKISTISNKCKMIMIFCKV